MTTDLAWSAAQRLERFAGEVRVKLIRLAALVPFCRFPLCYVG